MGRRTIIKITNDKLDEELRINKYLSTNQLILEIHVM